MVENICGQGFAYAHEVEERRQKIVKLRQENTTKLRRLKNIFWSQSRFHDLPFL
jgi:hypothetical protein